MMRSSFGWYLPVLLVEAVLCADVFIKIPGDHVHDQTGSYRLDYSPPHGAPPPNSTFSSEQIARGIELTRALPGTKYDFDLYYSNASVSDWPMWMASITTVPAPPANLSVIERPDQVIQVWWDPPAVGGYTDFKLKVIPLSETPNSVRNMVIAESQEPFNLRNLVPGASYEFQLYTRLRNKDSAAYIAYNFTTRPNAPGRFIVWYRNETTMLVLWQPPYPIGIYSQYRVSISPPDSPSSVLLVDKVGDPPGPAQAAFHGLVPGRAYNITVETKSGEQISTPTTAQYRTIPMPPRNLTFDDTALTSDSFTVRWEAPEGSGEYDSYRLSLLGRNQINVIVRAEEKLEAVFSRNLEPGKTYSIVIKTLSDNVNSWPIKGNVTTLPLPVKNIEIETIEKTDQVSVTWSPAERSHQDSYQILYQELETLNGHSRSFTSNTSHLLHSGADLYPGRNYSVSVEAISDFVRSRPVSTIFITKPASPIIEDLQPIPNGLNISWKSDVKSRQDKYTIYFIRNDTGEEESTDVVDPHILLDNLYPGAGYEIRIFAISHGKYSDPHIYFKDVYPNPIRNLTITDVGKSYVILSWLPPLDSLYSHFVVRHWSIDSPEITDEKTVNITERVVVRRLDAGERYVFEVRSASHRIETLRPLKVIQTVPPNSVYNVVPFLDSRNITFEWSRPEGRIDFYTIVWWSVDAPNKKASKDIPGSQATEGINRKLSVFIGELFPGDLYKFEIFTTSHGVQSETFSIPTRTTPLITSEITFVPSRRVKSSFTIRYTPTPEGVATFDLYRFLLSDPNVAPKEKLANDTDRKVVFEGLTPGHLYNTTVWTVSGSVLSQPLVREFRLAPDPISDIHAVEITDSGIFLEWKKPEGEYSSYEVHYRSGNKVITLTTEHEYINVTDLRPHRNYDVTIYTKSGLSNFELSEPVSATFKTREGTPGKVSQLTYSEITPNSIMLTWSLQEKNGVLTGYKVSYWSEADTKKHEVKFRPDINSGMVTKLKPGHKYIFEIQAETKVGFGKKEILEKVMPIGAPPKPRTTDYPNEIAKSSRSITISFRRTYFSEENGPITNYTVIVAEDDSQDSSSLSLFSWRDVQSYRHWPPYQAILPFNPFPRSSDASFVIGDDEECPYKHSRYCNGPLKPGTDYKIKLRAFTTPDKFTDTYFSQSIITDSESSNVGLAVTIPILVLAVVVVGVIFIKKRRVGPFLKKTTDVGHREDIHSLSDSIIETSRPVQIRNFAEHYRYMSADSDFRFSDEYEALKNADRMLPCVAADLPVNRPKNRFTNILPYDHSRFKLQPTDDEEGSDYINANFVSGFNSPREFIVTQGPLVSTRDDFWRMCWESNSRAVVMLTRCIEKGREKCDRYWPYDTKPVYYGDIQVTTLNESHYADWSITEFRVCKGDICRIIRQFHFTTWPDFGVPDPPQTLVRFVRAFRERHGSDQKPIVVHCSAGVGRSGTFIALDRILHTIRVSDYVDIFGIVCEMRRERVWMVQNEQQYICIHQCLLAVLEGRENEHSVRREIHTNDGFEDDEGIAEQVM